MSLREINLKLVNKARLIVYVVALVLTLATWFLFTKDGVPNIFTANAYGYLAFTFLSLALMVTPIRTLWPKFELNSSIYLARRALGVSAFVFAFLHSLIQAVFTFKGNLGIVFQMALGGKIWQLVGLIALVLLFFLFATSFNYAVDKLGKRWFTLHKLAYVAYALIFLHAFMIGIDFKNGAINAYSGTFLVIAAITLILEAARFYVKFTTPTQQPQNT
ncbi:MAG: ferric reductase-like transmembrane domain-containing protein [Candidatus Micrarchaeota archaeon]|nr:ferric reductase-like transmembrane domain-containing protein [Candidatus Micrarchaeota archaeon]